VEGEGVIQNRAAQIVAELGQRFGKWHLWYVPHAVGRALTWHAHRWDDVRHMLHAASPDELAKAIEQAEQEAES